MKARIAELVNKAAAEADAEMSPAWVLRRLKIEAEHTGEGSSHGARVSALATAAKVFGMFTADKPHPDAPPVDLKLLTDEALDRVLATVEACLSPELRALCGAGEGAADAAGGVE